MDRIQDRFKSNYVPRKKNLIWVNGKVKALGVWVCTDQNLGMKMNYEEKVRKVEDILNN